METLYLHHTYSQLLLEFVLLKVLRCYLAKGGKQMERINSVIETLDRALDTDRKRHILGGLLLSTALLFAGLSLTTLTIKSEELKDER